MQCLWVVAYYGNENIIDFYIGMDHPMQLTFIDKDNNVFQLTYVDVYNLQNVKALHIPKKYYDSLLRYDPECGENWYEYENITYVAVVLNEKIAESLKNMGFDYFAFIDKKHDDKGNTLEILNDIQFKKW